MVQQSKTTRLVEVFLATAFFASLFWWYPNLIHEPMHWLALKSQGSSGIINFDWKDYPAHPSITRTSDVSGVVGGLVFVLAPSVLSVFLGILAWVYRMHASLITHVSVPIYLMIDLIVNLLKYDTLISDFKFLSLFPTAAFISAACVGIAGCALVAASINHIKEEWSI